MTGDTMLKVHTDKTVLLEFGERPGQVGNRFGAESMSQLRKAHDNMLENRYRGKWKSKLTTEVPNDTDKHISQPVPQGDNSNLVIPRRVKERDPIKGRDTNRTINDPVVKKQVGVCAPATPPVKRNTIDVGDYIQLDLI